MKHLKWLAVLLLAAAIPAYAQQLIFPSSGAVTINANQGTYYFKVLLNQNVTSFTLTGPTGAPSQITVQFQQDSTGGRTVTGFASNISTTCSPSTTANSSTLCQFIYDAISLTWNGIAAGGGASNSNSINLANPKYNLHKDGQICYGTNVGTTNTSNVVTCAGANFLTSANTNQVMWATTGCCTTARQYLGGRVLAESAITSVDSDTQVHVANNASFTCSANAQCLLLWGTLDDTAISAAEADGNAITTYCPSYSIPSGLIVIHGKHWITFPAQCAFGSQLGSATSYSTSVIGTGQASSIFLITPSFDNASGGGACGATGCLFSGNQQIIVEHLGVYGGGCGNCGTANSVYIAPGLGSQFSNVSFAGFAAGSSPGSTTGMSVGAWRGKFVSVDGFGNIGMSYGGTQANNICLWCFVGDTNGDNVRVTAGDTFDYGSDYGGSGGGNLLNITGGTYHGYGSHAFACPASGSAALNLTGGNADLTDTKYDLNGLGCSGNTFALAVNNASSTAIVHTSKFTATGTGNPISSVASSKFVDEGGNTTSGGAGNSFSANTYFANPGPLNNAAPTISSGFGTTPSISSHGGALSFRVNVGGGAAATSGVVGLPTAPTGWNCQVTDTTNNTVTRETANSVSSVTVTAAAAWAANDILIYSCTPF